MDSIYADVILDYYNNPRNFGRIENSTVSASDENPLCGDFIGMEFVLRNDIVEDIKFYGDGCAISKASASMLTEMVLGKRLKDADAIKKEDLLNVLGIELGPVRIKCALLGYKVLRLCLLKIKEKSIGSSGS